MQGSIIRARAILKEIKFLQKRNTCSSIHLVRRKTLGLLNGVLQSFRLEALNATQLPSKLFT